MSPPDHALAVAIAGEVLRRIPDLDALIDSATRNNLPEDSKARLVLRMALAQKIGLRTKDHAIVATALPLVDGGPRRLVHGVLGTLFRRGVPESRSARLPDPVEERWRRRWGGDVVAAARRLIVHRPPLDLSFADDAEAQSYARDQGGISLAPASVRLESAAVSKLAGFSEGRWWVQDLAASLPARLISGRQSHVLDLCAAPGGKTMQLASNGHEVTALDWSKSRLGRLEDNLGRTGLTARLVEADALEFVPKRPFDMILLDAPCSATGTFRRHPEVLYRARPSIIADNSRLQARLLQRSSQWVPVGGAIVYSVCSMEPEEGEDVIAAFLEQNPGFSADPPEPGQMPSFVPVSSEGWIRILPGLLEAEGGLDGFFMVRLVRTA